MPDISLDKYIEDARSQGTSNDAMRTALLGAG